MVHGASGSAHGRCMSGQLHVYTSVRNDGTVVADNLEIWPSATELAALAQLATSLEPQELRS